MIELLVTIKHRSKVVLTYGGFLGNECSAAVKKYSLRFNAYSF